MRRRRPAGNRAVRLLAIVLAALLTITMPVAALGAEEGQEVPAAGSVAEPQPQGTEPAAGEKQKEETAPGETGNTSGSGETTVPGETGGENGASGQEEAPGEGAPAAGGNTGSTGNGSGEGSGEADEPTQGTGTPASDDGSGSGETAAPGETGSEAGTGSGDGQADGGELPGANVPGEGENADGGETPGADTPGEQGTDECGQTSETVRKTLTLHIVGTDGTVGEEIGTARVNVGSTLSLTALLETERRVEQAGEAAENGEAVETAETGGDGAAAQEAAWSVTTEAAPCEVVWTSSDTSIATVTEDGVVKGVTGGTVTITATAADDESLVAELTLTSYAGKWKKVNKKWKFVLPNGKYAKNRFVTVDGKKYYLGSDQYMKTGWFHAGKSTYYANGSGVIQKGWKSIKVTEKVKGKKKKVARNYYFDPVTGVLAKGWKKLDGRFYYFAGSGKNQTTTGWQKLSKVWYYMVKDENGHIYAATDWKQVKGKWYYLDPSDKLHGRMKTGWYTEGENTHYLNSNGASVTGVQTISKKKYLFLGDEKGRGVLFTGGNGPTEVNGKVYYFNADGKTLRTGWITEDGKTYYYGSYKITGWKKVSGIWYYLDGDGVRQTGWITLSGKTYYLQPGKSGAMATGWKTIDGAKYYFRSSGAMAVDTVVDGMKIGPDGKMTGPAPDATDRKAQGYSSSTSYLILVNRSSHKVSIYKGSKGKWKRVKRWSCGDGAKSTPTPEGTFKVGIKMKYFDTASNNRCWYATQFWGDYLFHSILYVRSGSPSKVRGNVSSQLGRAVSHGCVRLTLDNAKWIYNNVPSGTKVVVYH